MRIAYFTETYPPELNGVALTVQRTVDYLRNEAGHVVDLIRPRQAGESAGHDSEQLLTAGWPIPMYPDLRFGVARTSTLSKRFELFRPELVHIATQGPLGWAASRAARRLGTPVTTDFRTNFHRYGNYYGLGALTGVIARYLRDFHNRAAATFVPTEELRAELAADGFERLHVVGRGVDTSRFDPALRDEALRASWGAGQAASAPVVLYVGRLAAEKNVPLVLEAFEAARAAQPRAVMVVVGDGPLAASLKAAHPAVRFVGALRGAELARCYASADVFAFASMSETFGNVVVEAMASGLVVVAFRTAAAGELIANDESGVLVDAGDAAAFTAALCHTVARFGDYACTAHLARLRARAREVASNTGWASVLGRFDSHLTSVVDAYKTNNIPGPSVARDPV